MAGFRLWGLGFRGYVGLGFGLWGLGFSLWGLGFRGYVGYSPNIYLDMHGLLRDLNPRMESQMEKNME